MEHDFCYILYTRTGDKLKLEVVFDGGGVGQQLNTLLAPFPLLFPTNPPPPTMSAQCEQGVGGKATARETGAWGGASSNHMARDAGRTCNRIKDLKTVKSNRSREKRESVMYNIIYTLQLGLHLELRTSPKEVTF